MNKFWVESLQTSVSALGFGAAGISGGGGYSFGDVSEAEAINVIRRAIEFGINIFDTAPIYGFGLSEERLGCAIKASDDVLIVTKGGVDWHSNKRVNMTNEPAIIERMLHQSLARLQRDYIDLYMIHWPDPRVDIRAPLEVLVKAKEQGKIKHIGLANTTTQELEKAQGICAIDAFQCEFNLWQRQHYDELEPYLENRLFMGWGTFDKGILSGRVHGNRVFEKSDARSWAPWWNKKEVQKKVAWVEKFRANLSGHGVTMAQLSYWFTQIQSQSTSALIGVKNHADLETAIALTTENPDVEIIEKLSRLFRSFV